jgi:hypothetical protein
MAQLLAAPLVRELVMFFCLRSSAASHDGRKFVCELCRRYPDMEVAHLLSSPSGPLFITDLVRHMSGLAFTEETSIREASADE